MGKIEKLEDLEVWRKSRQLVLLVYDELGKLPSSEKYNLADQMRRSVVSVPANIAEGFGRYHMQESIYFYRNSRGSLAELKTHLYIAFDLKYINKSSLNKLLAEIDEIGKMTNGLINSTKKFRTSR